MALVVVFVACEDSVTGPRGTRVPLGTWGGTSASLTVTTHGADGEFGCMGAKINRPLVADAFGRFDVSGDVFDQAGPVNGFRRAARFLGQVAGDTLTLEIRALDSGQRVGPIVLRFGEPFSGGRCV
jgi:hypothetical protein